MGLGEITHEAVMAAIGEHDELGADRFLAKYGFGRARQYRLVLGGRDYDSKAIVGVAHRYVGGVPLSSDQFSGGVGPQGATTILRRLGFTVVDQNPQTIASSPDSAPVARKAAPGPSPRRQVPSADVVLVGCVKQKRDRPAPARELYTSSLFQKRRAYADASGRPWFILSALHGLLDQDQVVEPYDVELKRESVGYRRSWGQDVARALETRLGPLAGRTVEVHAGASYVEAIDEPLTSMGATLIRPLEGLTQGRQLAWYGRPTVRAAVGTSDLPVPSAAEAVALLTDESRIHPARDFPWPGEDVNSPGLYSWWVDAAGAAELSRGLGLEVAPGLVYAGQAGAASRTASLLSGATLRSRIGRNHLAGRFTSSTWRQTLASVLAEGRGWDFAQNARLGEAELTDWMREHLRLSTLSVPSGDALAALEDEVLHVLDPPLNLQGMPSSPIRIVLKALRGALRSGPDNG